LQGRELSLPIAATVRDYTLGGTAVFVDQLPAADWITLGRAQIITVVAKPNTPIEPLAEKLKPLVESAGISVQSFAEIRGRLDVLIAGIVGALWGLLAIGFVIGGLAVANTLSMSVFEQTRELGLLRIIGMTRPQMRRMIFCESLLLGILGTLLGTLAGLTTAWIIHLCNEPLLGHAIPFTLHTWLVVANAVACLIITMLAAWLPGERAARLDFLSAIAYE
ncbi:MAG: FtsX-like permease family protein, partial [Pirellulales bacterium]